jgi:hypothetical protein
MKEKILNERRGLVFISIVVLLLTALIAFMPRTLERTQAVNKTENDNASTSDVSDAGLDMDIFFHELTRGTSSPVIRGGNEPDLPGILRGKINKEAFMLRRAEYVGLKRGIDKKNPVDPKLRQTAIAEMEQQQVRLATMPESNEKESLLAPWMSIGPAPIPNGQVASGPSTPVSGRVTAIAVDPTNPNIVYVGAAQGGVYRSTDGGANWTPLLDSAFSLAIGAIAIAPSQPNTVYVGTGEPNFSSDSYFGVGVYRIDNASTASPVITGPLNRDAANADIFSGRAIGEILVHPTDPATIFVASASGIAGLGGFNTPLPTLPSRGIYRSTNATSASPVFAKLTGLEAGGNFSIRDMILDPLNPNLLVCSLIANGGGIYVSTNALAASPTFTRRVTFSSTSTSELTAEFAIQHTVGVTNPTIYAATGNLGGRVLINTDGGTTWTQQIDNNFCTPQCFYDIAIDVDPTNPARVYLGGSPTLIFGISTTSGTSFTSISSGLHVDSHAITVAPSQPSTIYFGSDGGIYKSIDSGANWTALNNTQFNATQFMGLAVHPSDPNFTIGGTQDNGTNFYRPNATWTRVDFGDGGYAVIDQNAADTTNVRMYHTYFNQTNAMGYARVTNVANAMDNGWNFFGCGFGGTANGMTCTASAILFYAPMEQGPGNPNTLYFGSDVLYRSSDGGTTVTKVSQEPITFGVPISSIGVSPQNDSVRIVGLADGGLFGTTTGSTTLTNLDTGGAVPNAFVARSIIDPNNVNTAYVTLSTFGVANVWRTTNLNSATPTWTSVSGSGVTGVPQVPVSAFLVDPTDSNTLYAGTDIGVYVSTNGGATWAPFGTGLPIVAVFDMAITPNPNRKLRIATHGRGLYEMTLGGVPSVSINDVSLNEGNTGTTNFTFNVTLSAASSQTITVGFATADGTATAGSDYVANSGTVTFNPNVTSQPITVLVNGDTTVEPNETFFVNLSNPTNATIADNQGLGTIVNDDGAGCTYSLNPTSQNFPVGGGSNSVQVITQAGCAWTAVSNSFAEIGNEKGKINLFKEYSIIDALGSPEAVFTNPTAITIPSGPGNATPYPSAIVVSGLTGNIANSAGSVKVTLNNFSHTFPDDVAMVLVGPTGAALELQSGATSDLGGQPASNVTYTISDTGATALPDNAPLSAGTFKPAVYYVGDSFPAPGPLTNYNNPGPAGGGTATFTSTFGNTAPNGTWNLFIRDFVAGDSGTISGGWTLEILTTGGGFITITSGSSGTGNGTVNYSVAANGTGAARQGTMTIAGQTFTVNQSGPTMTTRKPADFDGDSKTDLSIFRPSVGQWWYQRSSNGTVPAFTFGTSTDKIVPADYTGDGKTDIAFFRPSTAQWFVLRSEDNTFFAAPFGSSTDIPAPGDFDMDGKADLAVYRQSAGVWFILKSSDNMVLTVPFGISQDIPVVADYDADGKSDVAIYRPMGGSGNAEWWILRSTAGLFATPFGSSTDKPVQGDYTGDGKADIAFFRPSTATWFVLRSEDLSFFAAPFGAAGDVPVPGDYEGDNRFDLAVFRPSNVTWFVLRSSGGNTAQAFGTTGDIPVPSAFIP